MFSCIILHEKDDDDDDDDNEKMMTEESGTGCPPEVFLPSSLPASLTHANRERSYKDG